MLDTEKKRMTTFSWSFHQKERSVLFIISDRIKHRDKKTIIHFFVEEKHNDDEEEIRAPSIFCTDIPPSSLPLSIFLFIFYYSFCVGILVVRCVFCSFFLLSYSRIFIFIIIIVDVRVSVQGRF